jgi:hypothetical protein
MSDYLDTKIKSMGASKRLYQSVTNIYNPPYQRDLTKNEGNVNPD